MELEDAAAHLAERQRGLITSAQARRLGFSADQIEARLKRGRWFVVRRNVYVLAGAPRSWEQLVVATLLSAGEGTYASHDTALRLYGGPVRSARIELSSARERRVRLAGVRAHRSVVLFDADCSTLRGIPVTSAARMVVDLSRRRTVLELGRITDDLLRRRLLRLPELVQCAARLGPAPGRSIATVHEVLRARWDGYDPGDSDLESRVLRAIVAAGLPLPRQQVRVTIGGRRCYLDLGYVDVKLAVEIDSWAYHRFRSSFDGDRAKSNELVLLGWRVLRVTDGMSDGQIVALVRRGLEALGHFAVA